MLAPRHIWDKEVPDRLKQALAVPQVGCQVHSSCLLHAGTLRTVCQDHLDSGALNASTGTNLRMSTAYHPQTDGLTERANRTVEQVLRNFVNDTVDDWDEHIAAVQFALNNSQQASTKKTPFELVYGRHPLIPAALLGTTDTAVPAANSFLNTRAADIKLAKKHLKEAQERQARSANRTRRDAEFKVGDLVKLSTEHTSLNVGPALQAQGEVCWTLQSAAGSLKDSLSVNTTTRLDNPPSIPHQ